MLPGRTYRVDENRRLGGEIGGRSVRHDGFILGAAGEVDNESDALGGLGIVGACHVKFGRELGSPRYQRTRACRKERRAVWMLASVRGADGQKKGDEWPFPTSTVIVPCRHDLPSMGQIVAQSSSNSCRQPPLCITCEQSRRRLRLSCTPTIDLMSRPKVAIARIRAVLTGRCLMLLPMERVRSLPMRGIIPLLGSILLGRWREAKG